MAVTVAGTSPATPPQTQSSPASSRRFALGISYLGTSYHGWQRQESVPSVQADLEQALSQVADEPIVVQGAGRTDRGVHAIGQVASFTSTADRSLSSWRRGANSQVQGGAYVDWLQPVDASFDPRRTAVSRRYLYVLAPQSDRSPQQPLRARELPMLQNQAVSSAPMDVDAMHQAAQVLLGEHDFSSFRASGCQSVSPHRHMHRLTVRRIGAYVVVDLTANAFLLHMVRNIVGALVEIGGGLRDGVWLRDLLGARDRQAAPPTAPPHGLYLAHVAYPDLPFPQPSAPPILAAYGGLERL